MSRPDSAGEGLGRRAGLIALIAALTHVLALGNGFVWLDHLDIEAGAATLPLASAWKLWLRGYAETGFYRPVIAFSLSLDALANAPWAFHAQNLLWHALAAVTLAAAIQRLSGSRGTALYAASLFAVHPVSSPIVNGILFRPELIVATALFVLLWAHAAKRPLIAGAALFIGGLSKETALVLGPAFIVVLMLWRRERPKARLWVAEAVGLSGALALRLAFAPPWRASGPTLTLSDAAGTRLGALARSALQFVFTF